VLRIRRTNPQNIDKKYQAKFLCASARMNIFFLPAILYFLVLKQYFLFMLTKRCYSFTG